jgi:hypothetical protein
MIQASMICGDGLHFLAGPVKLARGGAIPTRDDPAAL